MDFNEFEIRLEEARTQRVRPDLPPELNPFDFVTASKQEVADAEATLNVRLPGRYKEFVQRVGGGSFLFLDVLPVTGGSGVGDDLLRANRGPMSVPGFLLVAAVGTGDWWGFPVSDGVCDERVFFWDHETGDTQFESSDFFEFLAKQGLSLDR